MRILVKFLRIISLLLSIGFLLTACQPPPSGEAAGWRSPYLYWQLQRAQLEAPLQIPVEGVRVGQINDTWGAARSDGRKHEGTDIFAKRVTGPNMSQHYYAHLDDYAEHIQEGDWVEAGEVIAYVGNTGNAKNTPPHLHYGIYLGGQGATNPYPYLVPSP